MVQKNPETLKVRCVMIDTYKENVAYLHRECSIYRAEGFQALAKVRISAKHRQILAVLNVVDDASIVGPSELGLSEQAFAQLGLRQHEEIRVDHAQPPTSMDAVRRKILGERLKQQDFHDIADDIVHNRYSKMELAAFLVASGQQGLDRDEVLFLTQAMLNSGECLDWDESLVVDKHCIGGIPGNRTTMLIVPIVAAHGLLIPKTSSRAITSPAGTADTMEVIAEVELEPEALRQVVRQQRGCLAWGGTARLAPADDILISVERPLGIDSSAQMVASILSKKLAAGSTHLLIDIPVGPTAKIRHMQHALGLRKLFEFVADRLGLHLEVVISDGTQPVGRGIGPVLEARDVLQVLDRDPQAPTDLRQRALQLAGQIIEFDPEVRGGHGYYIAQEILESGRAQAKMNAIIEAQGPRSITPKPGPLSLEVKSPHSGVITEIDNLQMARIARIAGAPMDKGAGVDLLKKSGESIEKEETLYRIHAEFPSDFKFACRLVENNNGYTIGRR
jgi:thymidine phosphorylase